MYHKLLFIWKSIFFFTLILFNTFAFAAGNKPTDSQSSQDVELVEFNKVSEVVSGDGTNTADDGNANDTNDVGANVDQDGETVNSRLLQPKNSRSVQNILRGFYNHFRFSGMQNEDILDAFLTGNVEVIEQAINEGFDFNKKVKISEKIKADILGRNHIKNKTVINLKDIKVVSFLGIAILLNKIDIVKRLALDENVDLNKSIFKNKKVNSLILAVLLNNKEMVHTISFNGTMEREENTINFNIVDSERGWTALFWATCYDFSEILNELMPYYYNYGMSFNDLKSPNGYNLLHFATIKGSKKCFMSIVSFIDINDIDATADDGETAMHLAARLGDEYFVNKLIEKGCNFNQKNKNTQLRLTPLALAILNNTDESHESIIKIFLDNPMIEVESAIHVAMQQRNYNLFDKLIKYDSFRVNSSDTASGAKVIDRAILLRDTHMVTKICKIEGVDLDLATYRDILRDYCDENGKHYYDEEPYGERYIEKANGVELTPVQLAVKMGDVDILRLLVRLPCDVNQKTSTGKTAFNMVNKLLSPNAETIISLLEGKLKEKIKSERELTGGLSKTSKPGSMTFISGSVDSQIGTAQNNMTAQLDYIRDDSSESTSRELVLASEA